MEKEKGNSENQSNRRNFLKIGLVSGGSIAAGAFGISKILSNEKKTESGIKKNCFYTRRKGVYSGPNSFNGLQGYPCFKRRSPKRYTKQKIRDGN